MRVYKLFSKVVVLSSTPYSLAPNLPYMVRTPSEPFQRLLWSRPLPRCRRYIVVVDSAPSRLSVVFPIEPDRVIIVIWSRSANPRVQVGA